MTDLVVFAVLVLSAALLFTIHLSVVWGLARRPPRRDAAIAFLLVPAAPWLAWRHGMKTRAILWPVALVLYVVARLLAAR